MSLKEQIKCIERELAMRKRVYPRLVSRERMSQEDADHETEAMGAVLETLREIAQPKLIP